MSCCPSVCDVGELQSKEDVALLRHSPSVVEFHPLGCVGWLVGKNDVILALGSCKSPNSSSSRAAERMIPAQSVDSSRRPNVGVG
jgi:hypothetical protein